MEQHRSDSLGAETPTCVVCHRPISGRVHTVGGRPFCDEHHPRADRGGPPALALLAGLIAFGLLMQFVGPALSPLVTGGWRTLGGLAAALLPALLWLFVFQRLDRLEREPIHFLLGVMLLAALLAGAVGDPLRRGLFALDLWTETRPLWAIPVYALTQGTLLALIVYLTVRWSVFLTDEFDERTDGVMYGTAAGLGVAVLFNVRYVLEHPGLRLDVGTARIIVAALAMASIGGLIGYALGQVRFEPRSVWRLPAFVAAGALLTGVFEWISDEAAARALGYSAWAAMLAAALFAALVFGVVFVLARSAVRETLAAEGTA